MRKYLVLLFIASFYFNAFTQSTKSLNQEVSLDSLVKTVREFSGEDSTIVNGSKVRIVHRVSRKGNNLASDYLAEQLTKLGLSVEQIDYRNGGRNVVGTLLGKTNPDSIYIISAHYDAVADYCADDDASGSATVLEAARIMTKYCFKNTIKFAFWDEEERGLVGSHYYADTAAAHGDHILGVLNMDMMGYDSDSNKVFDIHTNANPENQILKDTVLFVLNTLKIDLIPKVINPGTTRSDHASFWKRGYPAVFCGESFIGGDPNPAYHTSKDRIDLFDLNYYHKLAQLAIGTIVELTGVIPTAVERDTATVCHEYKYKDSTFFASTVYYDSLKTTNDCDSIFVLDLTILPIYKTIDTIQVCYKYVYRNKDYFNSGIYHDTLTSRNGCDSIYTMDLTVLPIYYETDTIIACESYQYKNKRFFLSGFYNDTLTSRNGCDSVYTIALTVLPIYTVVDAIDVCGSYTYRNKVITSTGIYRDTLVSRNGCDSFYIMHLTIRPLASKRDTIFKCGDYTYRGQAFTSSGIYHDTLTAVNGCDSMYTFDLRITRINDSITQQGSSLVAFDSQSTYQWVRCDSVRYKEIVGATARIYKMPINDAYAVVLKKNQCVDTSDCIPVKLAGIQQHKVKGFTVYPNPSNGLLNISTNRLYEDIKVELYGLNGTKLATYQFHMQQLMQLRLPEQSGLYFVRLQNANRTEIYKVIKID